MDGSVVLEVASGASQPQVLVALRQFGAISRVAETAWEFAWMPVPSANASRLSIVHLIGSRTFRWSLDALDVLAGSLLANLANLARIAAICERLVRGGTVGRFVCFPPDGELEAFSPGSLRGSAAFLAEPGATSDMDMLVIGLTAFPTAAIARISGTSTPGERELFARLAGYTNVVQHYREETAQTSAALAATFGSDEGDDINERLRRAIEALRNHSRGST
ncbi:MAG: hypothetical protein ACYDGM_05185 [Vulcanimicrobiaceae bacterium]